MGGVRGIGGHRIIVGGIGVPRSPRRGLGGNRGIGGLRGSGGTVEFGGWTIRWIVVAD